MGNMINDIREKYKRAVLEMLILRLLTEEDKYGYQLKTEINKRSEGFITLTEGVLYPPLYRMSHKGMISERKVIVNVRRERVYYHIEPAGIEYLEMLEQEYDNYVEGVRLVREGHADKKKH